VVAGNSRSFAYNGASKTCSNISCHNGNGIFIAVDVQWGATMPSDCSGCHGGNAAATTKMTSNYHPAHINNASALGANLGCVECHANTVSSDSVISTSANHLNGLANFSGAKSGKNKASCQAAYCHSSGKGAAGTAVNWTTAGTALDCKGCHGGGASQAGEPVYASGAAGSATANNHPKHVGTTGANATCQNCHGTTMSGTALSATGIHLNKTIDVVQGNSKTFGYIPGSKTCSNSGAQPLTVPGVIRLYQARTAAIWAQYLSQASTVLIILPPIVPQVLGAGQQLPMDLAAPTATR
jgi:predicted CxxxxCH...CXXCH cytochrome family protein